MGEKKDNEEDNAELADVIDFEDYFVEHHVSLELAQEEADSEDLDSEEDDDTYYDEFDDRELDDDDIHFEDDLEEEMQLEDSFDIMSRRRKRAA